MRDLEVEAQRQRPNVPVLLTSGYDQEFGSDDGGTTLLRKPYRQRQLVEAIERALLGRAA